MKQATVRYSFYFAAALVVGPICGGLVAGLSLADGSPQATALVSTNPVMGVLLLMVSFLLAGLLGVAASRFSGMRVGFTTAGIALMWPAWRSGNIDQILRSIDSGSVFWKLAVEGGLLAIIAVIIAVTIWFFSSERLATPEDQRGDLLHGIKGSNPALLGGSVLGAVAAGAVVGAAFAVSPLKGQTIASGVFGGIFAATALRLAWTAAPAYLSVIAVGIIATIGPIAGAFAGSSPLDALNRHNLWSIAIPVPIDWYAGGFFGIPIGLSWAAGLGARAKGK